MEKVLIAEETTASCRRVVVDAACGGTEATQLSFLLRSLANPRAGIGIIQTILRFHEAFQGDLFQASVQTITDRHTSLRRTFVRAEGGFEERTAGYAQVAAKVVESYQQARDPLLAEWNALLRADRELGFDPAVAPLLRCTYVQPAPGETWVVLTFHHLLVDGLALNWILREIVEEYDCARMGKQRLVPSRRLLTQPDAFSQDSHAAENYWKSALWDLGKESPLASLRRVEPSSATPQESMSRTISEQTSRRLQAAATESGCSYAAMVHAAWAILLHRVSQETEVAFLTVRSMRTQGAAARVLGSFVRSSPLKLSVGRMSSFAAVARQADTALKDSGPFASTRLTDIKAWTNVPESFWDSNVLFDRDRFTSWFSGSGAQPGNRSSERRQHSDVPLTLAAVRDRALTLHFQHWSTAFRPGIIEDLGESLVTLLEHAAAPESKVSELAYLSDAQRGRLAFSASLSSPGTAEAQQGLLLHGGFKTMATRQPHALAVQWPGGSASYKHIDRASDALAARLLKQGLTCEEPVAVLIERSAAHLVALLAVLKAGGSYLPLDPGHPDAHLQRITAAAAARICLAGETTVQRAATLTASVVPVTGDEQTAMTERMELPVVAPEQLAYLIATSGTTGLPKLVEVEHRAAANTLQHSLGSVYGAGDLAMVPWTDSQASDASIHQIFAALSCGGTLEPVTSIEVLDVSPNFPYFTTFGATPSVLQLLLASGSVPPRATTVLIGGEPCPAALPARLRAATGVRRLVNVYGPTETAIYSTADNLMAADEERTGCPISIGRPIGNIRVEILDRHLQPVIPGACGEICIAGIGLARGYRGNPKATATRFPELRGSDGEVRRYYRTGDLAARLSDGRIELRGRLDRQVKVRGVRVELDAIERRLEQLHGVARALVAVTLDRGGHQSLRAWVIPQAGQHLDEVELRRLARKDLPLAMVPAAITIIDAIPLTAAGKPDFMRLPVEDSVPHAAYDHCDEETQGWSEREQIIASIWRRVLKHDVFGRRDDFFEVGGDSLMGIELVLDLNELLEIQLSSSMFCGAWTIAGIAEATKRAPASNSFFSLAQHLPGAPQFWLMPNADDFAMFDRHEAAQPICLLCTEELENTSLTIEAYAASIVQQMRTVQPNGPYKIGGFCFAAFVAFEVARQLTAIGAEIAGLCIVDRQGPSRLYRCIDFAKKVLGRDRLHYALGPGWERRARIARGFRPCGTLAAYVSLVETGHSRRRHNPDSQRGWRRWTSSSLDIHIDHTIGPAEGIDYAVRRMSMRP